MLSIPRTIQTPFEQRLLEKAIPIKTRGFYLKWLRYYLDFCEKYDFPDANKDSLAPFLRKLQEKKQTSWKQQQAAAAVALYLDLIEGKALRIADSGPAHGGFNPVQTIKNTEKALAGQRKTPCQPYQPERKRGASWLAEYTRLSNEIQVRHYSPKTRKSMQS